MARPAPPRVQYTRAPDGVQLAYWTVGSGVPLVVMPYLPWSHLEAEWHQAGQRRLLQQLGFGRQLVRYDGRGVGLSDRAAERLDLDAQVGDLEAVADALGLERMALFAFVHAGPIALAYAARRPERVSHLVLWCSYASGAAYSAVPRVRSTRSLLAQDWDLYTETAARAFNGWAAGDEVQHIAELMRACATPEGARRLYAAYADFDVTDLLDRITTPTLILSRRGVVYPAELWRDIAAKLPGARFIVLEGDALWPGVGETTPMLEAIADFLGSDPEHGVGTLPPAGELVAILFTDVVGSTALTARLGDVAARAHLRRHDDVMTAAVARWEGRLHKHTGDGVMASFRSVHRALDCALDVQRRMDRLAASSDVGLRVRVGLHVGEPIAERADLFGAEVNLAARLCAAAQPGEVLVSNVVRELCRTRPATFVDRGRLELRGLPGAIQAWAAAPPAATSAA